MYNMESFSQINKKNLSPLEAMRILMSYPFNGFTSEFFHHTREYESGLVFVDICRDLLNDYAADIPTEEVQQIECNITFMELSFYDYLNQWQQYLDFFEHIFLEKRSAPFVATYCLNPNQNAQERFGRYLLGHDNKRYKVHKLYLQEDRRAVIKRKLIKQEFGKNVEHLKRHQKDQLSNEEYLQRVKEMNYLFECMKKQK